MPPMSSRATSIAFLASVLLPVACAPDAEHGTDGGRFDAGLVDAGASDAGTPDGGSVQDAGPPDSGAAPDGGPPDAGPNGPVDGGADAGDGGAADAGSKPDAGCAPVWSYTATALSPADTTALTGHLETIAAGWSQPAVDAANNILSKAAYGAPELTGFFLNYFVTTQHPYTDALRDYLGYPTFFWFDSTVHLKLQRALAVAFWVRSVGLTPPDATGLTGLLSSDAGHRDTLFNAHGFFASLGKVGELTGGERAEIFERYRQLATACAPAILKQSALNPTAYPWVPAWRAQVWMAFRDVAPLDAGTQATLAQALGLGGAHLAVWNAHTTLLYDNDGFSSAQKAVIATLLDAVPTGLLDLGGISQNDFLGNVAPRARSFQTRSGVNIFNFAIGAVTENSFPNDVAAATVDVFSSALAHECNHIIDAQVVEGSPTLKARKQALLSRAGLVDLQYLRSQVGGAFFQNAPQEFVASISNEWFTDTARTLTLAASRWSANYHEPMNQFLFFAELYSRGGSTTRFYRIDTASNLTVTDVPVTRDSAGRINHWSAGGKTYDVTYDAQGFAATVSVQ